MYIAREQLVLYLTDKDKLIAAADLIRFCQEQALIGPQEAEHRFQVGERFLSLLCFMGCSPHIELYPQANDGAYCYIDIPEPTNHVLISQTPKIPRCPHCKSNLTWLPAKQNNQPLRSHTCPDCQQIIDPSKLNWRKSAVFAASRLVINNIFEAEAIPDGNLMSRLQQQFGCEWRYAYIKVG